jgi:ribokinase
MRAFVVGNYMNACFLGVDRLPLPGESLAARSAFQEHGGKGFNLALGLHRLGVEADLFMAVGRDGPGDAVLAWLTAEGMRTDLIVRSDTASGMGVGFIAADGHNFLAAYLGANAALSVGHLETVVDTLARADWVLGQFESPQAVVFEALKAARRRGARTYLNPSPWSEPGDNLLALTDLLVVNETEAAALFALAPGEILSVDHWRSRLAGFAAARGLELDLLVVTLAERGAVALPREGEVCWRPAPVITQVDATGAGDAFGCGLIWALGAGRALPDALEVANRCGAMIAARAGVAAHLPTQAALAAFGF